jgi:hypothetical protein
MTTNENNKVLNSFWTNFGAKMNFIPNLNFSMKDSGFMKLKLADFKLEPMLNFEDARYLTCERHVCLRV